MIENQINEDLYPDLNSIAKSGPVKRHWYFLSNKNKLHDIIATGLIIEHYSSIKSDNSTSDLAGWVPLFTENNITSDDTDEDIFIKIDTNSLTGQAFATNNLSELVSKQFPDEFTSNDQDMYLRAPLPITTITEIVFPSKESKEDFIDRASGYKNENLNIFTLKVKKAPKNTVLKKYSAKLPQIEQDYSLLNRIQVAAAMRGMHFKFANIDADASSLYSALYSQNELTSTSKDIDVNDILKEIPYWMSYGEISPETLQDSTKKHVQLFWNIFKSIANIDRKSTVYDAVINELDNEQYGTWKQKLIPLKEDLYNLRNLSDKNLEQLFDDHKHPSSRALIIFFIRDKVTELVSFKDSQINMTDLQVASLLFSAREKWKNFSTSMRGHSSFAIEQSDLMANLFHNNANTGIKIHLPKRNIVPIYELLLGDAAIKSGAKKYRDTRVMVANEMGWNCVETTITLEKGVIYPMQVTGTGVEFTFDGLPKSVKTDVKHDEFKQLLAIDGIEDSTEEKVREKLK